MADSDDDYDKRNTREKFRHERNDYNRRSDRRSHEKSGSSSKYSSSRRSRERDSGRDRQRSPPRRDSSPNYAKRMRRDDGGPPLRYGPMHGAPPPPWGPGGHQHPSHQHPPGPVPEVDFPTQPPMMSYKHFLTTLEQNLTEEETYRRYNDYKADFKKKQILEFFTQHKEEEWFRSKYHPEECEKNQAETRQALRRRCQIFMKLLDMKLMDGVTVDCDRSTSLVKLLDQAVILMEGGTEYDFKCLEREYQHGDGSDSHPPTTSVTAGVVSTSGAAKTKKGSTQSSDISDDEDDAPKFTEPLKLQSGGDQTTSGASQQNVSAIPGTKSSSKVTKRDKGDDSDSSSSSFSDSDDEAEKKVKDATNRDIKEPGAEAAQICNLTNNGTNGTAELQPRPLHQTQSIFLRNLAPSITKQEVESLCKKYPGYMRVAIQDPQPERRFARRGWVTFDRNVNVKDICITLNNIRLRDCDMGAIVNRELRQRIRPVNGLAVHHTVAKQDIKLAAKIVQNFDARYGMWQDSTEKKDSEKMAFGYVSNPLVKNITDFLVDEGSYEEDALLGQSCDDKPKEANPVITLERDEKLLKVLDTLVLYLRLVYSFDYYSTVEYPNEDEMPHRCGIMYARGTNLSSGIHQSDIDEWMRTFDIRTLPFVNMKVYLDDADTIKLGRKNQEEEIEKFITANTQELAKDKWLCPLSGKKFKGPEFIRKHLQTKHAEKLEEVKKEAEYFNNYLKDVRRPQLPEHPSNRQLTMLPPPRDIRDMPGPPGFLGPPPPAGFYRPPPPPMLYPAPPYGAHPQFASSRGPDSYRPPPPPPPPPAFRPRERFLRRERTTRPDPRSIISYTDLDAPVEDDIF